MSDDGDESDLPRILVSNRQGLPVDEGGLAELARECLEGEGLREAELSVSFVSAEEMTGLHRRYLGQDGPTDVLAFLLDGEEDGLRILGDVVICPEVAAENNPDVAAELRLLLVHGVLHLLGYDHKETSERRVMWARQEAYSGVRVPLDGRSRTQRGPGGGGRA